MGADENAPIEAFALPEDLFLVRRLRIPELAEADLAVAVNMDIAGNSPFPAEDLCSGWRVARRSAGQIEVVMALASRAGVHAWLRREERTQSALSERIEVWAPVGDQGHVVLDGFGEAERRRDYYRSLAHQGRRWAALAACLMALLILPGLYTGIRAGQLEDQLQTTQDEARQATRLRERLSAQRASIDALSVKRSDRVPYHYWLHTLATMSPDTVYLSRLEFEGPQAEATGYAGNAADYLSKLAESQRFAALDAPGAFTRDRNSGLERFTITLALPPLETP